MNNPYNYNLPVSPNLFFGRQPEVNTLVNGLTASNGDSFALIGGRRMGKTSLLEAIGRSSAITHSTTWHILPIALDFTGDTIHSTAAFFHTIYNEAHFELATLLNPSSLPPFHLAPNQPPAPAFRNLLQSWSRALLAQTGKQLRLVLLLDECEQIVQQPWATQLHGALRYLLVNQRTRQHLKVVMTGSHGFLTQVQQRGSPLRNVLKYVRLATLPPQVTGRLITEPHEQSLPETILTTIEEQGGGHPFLTQYLLHHLWELGLAETTVAKVNQVANQFHHERRDFQDWMLALGETAWDVYESLANVEAADSTTPANTTPILDALCYHGLVNYNQQHDSYQIAGQMFRNWFKKQSQQSAGSERSFDLAELRQHFTNRFNEEELKNLCFDMDIDYESLAGSGKAGKVRELVAFCARTGRLEELVANGRFA